MVLVAEGGVEVVLLGPTQQLSPQPHLVRVRVGVRVGARARARLRVRVRARVRARVRNWARARARVSVAAAPPLCPADGAPR